MARSQCTITAADAFGRSAIRYVASIILLSLAGVAAGCGATAPTPPTVSAPAPTGPVVNIAGTWTGTMTSANLPTQSITMMVVQATNCVDGAWSSASSAWAGSISGYAGEASVLGPCLVREAGLRRWQMSRISHHQRTGDRKHAPLDCRDTHPDRRLRRRLSAIDRPRPAAAIVSCYFFVRAAVCSASDTSSASAVRP